MSLVTQGALHDTSIPVLQQHRTTSDMPTNSSRGPKSEQHLSFVRLCDPILTGHTHTRVFVFVTCNNRKGLDLEKLKLQAREEAHRKQKEEAASLLASFKKTHAQPPLIKTKSDPLEGARTSNVRQDSSPVKASNQQRADTQRY